LLKSTFAKWNLDAAELCRGGHRTALGATQSIVATLSSCKAALCNGGLAADGILLTEYLLIAFEYPEAAIPLPAITCRQVNVPF
jgi:hypothetical protein